MSTELRGSEVDKAGESFGMQLIGTIQLFLKDGPGSGPEKLLGVYEALLVQAKLYEDELRSTHHVDEATLAIGQARAAQISADALQRRASNRVVRVPPGTRVKTNH